MPSGLLSLLQRGYVPQIGAPNIMHFPSLFPALKTENGKRGIFSLLPQEGEIYTPDVCVCRLREEGKQHHMHLREPSHRSVKTLSFFFLLFPFFFLLFSGQR